MMRMMRMMARSQLVAVVAMLAAVAALAVPSAHALSESTAYVVEHAVGSSDFTPRGTIHVKSQTKGVMEQSISKGFAQLLYTAATEDKMYRVRVRSKSGEEGQGEQEEAGENVIAEAFIPACELYASGFSDSLLLHLNDNDAVSAVSISTSASCPEKLKQKKSLNPRTTVTFIRPEAGPVPNVAEFVEKVKEKETKDEEPQQKSFWDRMWVYIVPLVVVQLISAYMQSGKKDGNGGGAGGR